MQRMTMVAEHWGKTTRPESEALLQSQPDTQRKPGGMKKPFYLTDSPLSLSSSDVSVSNKLDSGSTGLYIWPLTTDWSGSGNQQRWNCTYADQQSRNGRSLPVVDHGQQTGQVTFSGSWETQPEDTHIGPGHYSSRDGEEQKSPGGGTHLDEVNR